MGGSGGGSALGSQGTNVTPDQTALANFVNNTQGGARYKNILPQTQGKPYWATNSGFQTLAESGNPYGSNGAAVGVSTDVSNLLNAFSAYQKDQSNAQSTWQQYATLVGQENGGQGQSTILGNPSTTGTAVGNPASVTVQKSVLR